MELHKEIKSAFAARAYPATQNICVAGDDEGTTEHFQGTSWQEHDGQTLAYHAFALHVFTPEAFCYYLPAYLLACLKFKQPGLVGAVIWALCPPKDNPHRPSYWAWWSLLTNLERKAIVGFLEYQRKTDQDISKACIEALRDNVNS